MTNTNTILPHSQQPNLPQLKHDLHTYFSTTHSQQQQLDPPPELSRFATFTGLGLFWGFLLGACIGSHNAGLKFLAEHAHHLPVTLQGWYRYHKSKNHHMILGGLKRGVKDAGRLGSIVGTFSAVETGIDLFLEQESPFSSVVAGVSTAAIFSLMNRLPKASAKRTIIYGSVAGFALTGIQLIASYALGHPVKYYRTQLSNKNDPLEIDL